MLCACHAQRPRWTGSTATMAWCTGTPSAHSTALRRCACAKNKTKRASTSNSECALPETPGLFVALLNRRWLGHGCALRFERVVASSDTRKLRCLRRCWCLFASRARACPRCLLQERERHRSWAQAHVGRRNFAPKAEDDGATHRYRPQHQDL